MHRPEPASSPDASVRSTDTDALVSRASAASLGYLSDPFAPLFLTPALRRSTEKRPPLINIGTHARTWAIDALVAQFLADADGGERQVLSLGAGTDTRMWRLIDKAKLEGRPWACRRWIEVDFEEATGGKARTVVGKQILKDPLGDAIRIEYGGTGLTSAHYALVPGDLRDFASLSKTLTSPPPSDPTGPPLLDPSLPTLLLAECVLVYLPPETTSDILAWFRQTFASGSAVSYDPFGLQDSFGKVMIRNLATRNLALPGAATTPSLDSLSGRLLTAGFATASSLSIKQIRESVIAPDELARVGRIEMIDEVEELNLVLSHYAITWGSFGAGGISLGSRNDD
ncbi:hypothetical protein RQP46_009130 [Phenoliferia psychrophenolica]